MFLLALQHLLTVHLVLLDHPAGPTQKRKRSIKTNGNVVGLIEQMLEREIQNDGTRTKTIAARRESI